MIQCFQFENNEKINILRLLVNKFYFDSKFYNFQHSEVYSQKNLNSFIYSYSIILYSNICFMFFFQWNVNMEIIKYKTQKINHSSKMLATNPVFICNQGMFCSFYPTILYNLYGKYEGRIKLCCNLIKDIQNMILSIFIQSELQLQQTNKLLFSFCFKLLHF